jgi:argininosuccinate lyase
VSDLRGRFSAELDAEMLRFSSSLELDLELADEDIRGSLAHVGMLGTIGVLSAEETSAIVEGLETIRTELASGSWVPDPAHDDIHMAVEARLVELVGGVGGKLHTARSRNDQVATAVRLWLKRRLTELDRALVGLIEVLLDRVETDGRTLMPGYTHLQRGQPVLLGHHLLAHAWAATRDRERIAGALDRADRCPLGAGAMAGTSHPIDRELTADELGFAAVADNAMDAVAARDHLQEAASVCAIVMTGLSRMAAELVLWSSAEFDLVRLGEAHSTGSSIMPQKRNPDGAELVRGKVGRVLGDLQALLVLVKGLPLAYNRDLQEDRAPLIDALAQSESSVKIMTAMWRDLDVRADRFESELHGDMSLATELADLLAERGVPFRTAHEAVAAAVRWCEEQGGNLVLLDGGAAARFHEAFPDDLGPWLDPRAAAERRTSFGGTAWPEVERQVDVLRSNWCRVEPVG